MQLTPDQISAFTTKAKQAGFSDAEIQQEIARKSAEVQPAPTAPIVPAAQQAPTTQTPQTQNIPQTSVAGAVGKGAIEGTKSAASLVGGIALQAPKFALDLAKEFVKPAVKGAKTVATAAEEAIQTGKYLSGDKKAFNSPILPDSIKLSPSEKSQIETQPIEEGLKQAAGIGSYAVPFGKAGFIGSKAVIPGAAYAASRSFSEGNTPEEVLGNAIIGGATAGTLQMGGKVLSKLKGVSAKTAQAAESGANAIEQGTRQIKLKPSIYGASQEKAVNETLDRLGFKGSPQVQYGNLEPAMNKLEGQIQTFISENPNISVPKESIKKSFLQSLQSSLRSGEMTQKQAVAETDKYLSDLVKASGGKGKFTDIPLDKLRVLKKLINEDYAPVKKILDTGGNLTPKQRVIAVSWDSIDNAIKATAPEVKSLLTDESNLYKSAPSLSRARSNPPVLRAMGTSVPQPVTQLIRDAAKEGLRGTASVANKVSDVVPSLDMSKGAVTLVGQLGTTIPSLGSVPPALNQVSNEGQNSISTDQSQIQTNSGQNNQDHNSSISQGLGEKPPSYINMWGASPSALYREYQNAHQHGDIKTAAYLFKVYQDEIAYQKANKGQSEKPLSAAQQTLVNKASTGVRTLDRIETELMKDPSLLYKKYNPLDQGGRASNADIKSVIDILGFLRTGATLTKEQADTYRALLPTALDSPDLVKRKIESLRQEFQGYLNQKSEVPDPTINTQGLGAEPPTL